MKNFIVLIVLIASVALAFGQDMDKAWMYFKNEQYELAAKEFESALPELRAYYGKNDTIVYSKYIFYTATSYFIDKQNGKAEKYFIQGKEIFERINGQANPKYLYFLKGLTNIYSQIGEYDKTILMLQEVLQKFEIRHGKDFSNYAWLLIVLGDIFFDLVEYEKVLPLYKEALEIREKVLGKEHPDYVISLNNLAYLYSKMGQYEKALPLNLESLEISEKALGKDNYEYGLALNSLAQLYYLMGQYDKALPYYIESIEIIENVLGKEHLGCAAPLNNLGLLYSTMGEHEKAFPLYMEALKIREKVLGKEHPEYANSLNNLALLYSDMGQYPKALPIYLEALEIIEKVVGKEHPDYTISLNNLAHLYSDMGLYEKALPLYFEALELTEKVFGKEHPHYAMYLNNYGNLYSYMGQYDKALPLLLEALEIREEVLGKEHPDYATSLNDLADLYYHIGQYEKVRFLLFQTIAIMENVMGKENSDYARPLNSLAVLYSHLGQFEKALSLRIEVLEIAEKALGKEHNVYATYLINLALLYSEIGQYEKALPICLEALEIYGKTLGKAHPDYASTLNNLAVLYSEMGQYEKALNLSLESLEIREKALGKEHPDYAISLNTLAELYSDMGQYEKALSTHLEALELIEKVLGKAHSDYAISLNNLAVLYSEIGLYEKALPLSLEALEIKEKTLGKEHPDYATSLNNLALLYSEMGQYEKALPIYLEALEILEKTFGKEHPDNAIYLNNLALLYSNMGQYEKALPIFKQVIENSLFNISQNFAFLSENEKNQYFSTLNFTFFIQKNFFKTYSSQNPFVSTDAFNLELATKVKILQSGIQMQQAIQSSGSEEAIIKYNEWLVVRVSLAKQYSLPLAERSEDLKDMVLKAEKLESELNMLSNTFSQAQAIGSIKCQDVQQQLGSNEVAIEFSSFPYYNGKQWTDSILYTANVLRPGDKHPHLVYLCEQRQLDSLLFQQGNTEPAFISGLYRGAELIENSMPSNGHRLYELIWEPIAQLLPDGATINFAPSGILHQIAHAAIPVNENTLLSDKYKLVQLSTTAQLLQDAGTTKTLAGEIVLFGGIEFDMEVDEFIALSGRHQDIGYRITQRGIPAGLERSTESWSYLPGTRAEVEAIGGLAAKQGMSVKSYTGKEALEERFKALSGYNSPTILHISTHGFFFPDPEKELKRDGLMMNQENQVFRASDNPLNRAGLLFAGANHSWQGDTVPEGVDDGILTAWEVTNVTLNNTKLVTLSACETGLGEVRGSEGVFGLQRAFKAAGANYLLMSLWKVPDQETAEFMACFYARLFEGSTIPDAFHATQQYMRTLYPAEPYKWAAFVLLR